MSIVFANTHGQYLSIRNSYEDKLQRIETLSENFFFGSHESLKIPFLQNLSKYASFL